VPSYASRQELLSNARWLVSVMQFGWRKALRREGDDTQPCGGL